jgi:hypothetical protein
VAGLRLIGLDLRIAADKEQPAGGVEDRDGGVRTGQAVRVIEVEDGGPGLVRAVDAGNRLDEVVVDCKGEPLDIGLVRQVAADADGVAVGREQVAQILRTGEGVVAVAGVAKATLA